MSQIQEVKQASDIVQLISERRPLQRSGTNWRGLCPFHSEKSPSFFVSEQMQRYKCFGCGETGDAFTFLEKYEGMTFAEGLQYLADRAGIKLEKLSFNSEDDQRQRLLEILDLAKEYFSFLLREHPLGEKARVYLKERGTSAESLKVFQMGYALDSWDGLIKFLNGKKKYSIADLDAAGLIVNKNGKTYDRFRGRVMFPLTDHRGRVVGFSGRVLDKEAKEAKYINSPETMLYHKSQMLFGFSQLYQEIRKANEAVVVEGEFDVISSAQAHVNNVVAVKGSALTEDHMRLLSRTVTKVILSFDMDSAGMKATQRAIEVARPFGIELRVIDFGVLASGAASDVDLAKKDPDELARNHPDLWRQAVKSSISVYDFFLRAAAKKFDLKTPEGKRQAIDELAPVLGQISHAVELDFYVKKLATLLDVAQQVVRADLQRFKELKKRGATGVREKAAGNDQGQSGAKVDPKINTRKSRLEEYVLFLLLNSQPTEIVQRAEKLKHMSFARTGVKQILQQLLTLQQPYQPSQFSKSLAEDLQQVLFDVSVNAEYLPMLPTLKVDAEWSKAVEELVAQDLAEETQKIQEELDSLDQKGTLTPEDEARSTELLKRVVLLRARKGK